MFVTSSFINFNPLHMSNFMIVIGLWVYVSIPSYQMPQEAAVVYEGSVHNFAIRLHKQ
jgi:hypothetical protein